VSWSNSESTPFAARNGSANGSANGATGDPLAGQVEAARERCLRLVLAAFEDGRLEAFEYSQRVGALERATSVDQMTSVVASLPPAGASATTTPGPRLDAVDLARLQATSARRTPSLATRYVALTIVVIIFAVLLGLGAWLMTRVHPATTGAVTVIAAALAAPLAGRR